MSLAMFAAPFDDEPSQVYLNHENPIEKKKMTKTLKKYPPINNNNNNNVQKRVDFQKVNQVMRAMNNLPSQNDELGDFNPPPPPMSSGVESTILRENMASINEPSTINNDNDFEIPTVSTNYNQNAAYNASSVENTNNTSMYKPTKPNNSILNIPNYNNIYKTTPYNTPTNTTEEQNVLMEKLNYMIHLLEEQQDERTGNVMEEVILYSFLGVFIIFIVDSFCYVGKYTR